MTQGPTPACNLLDEDWIPVRAPSGEVKAVSLTRALLDAAGYSALAETSPPNLIALHRLLLALLHRALTTHHGSWKDADRARWYRDGLPAAPIRAYLEQWRDRFWLFHPEHPFMQVAALAQAPETRDKRKPWMQITMQMPRPSEPIVFEHVIEKDPTLRPGIAVLRDMLGYFQFVPGGLIQSLKKSDKAGPLANSLAVVPTGKTLAETLLLGLHPGRNSSDDMPSWEQRPPTIAELKAPPKMATGANDRYTRRSRAVLLLPEDGSHQVRHIRFGAGLGLEEDAHAPDPMVCFHINKQGKPIRVAFTEGRSMWRELPALVPDTSGKSDKPPTILEGAANLYDLMDMWDRPVQVLVAGLASNQAKLLRWRSERVELPLKLLTDFEAASELRDRMRSADDLYFRLRGICAWMIAAAMPDPNHKDTRERSRDILAKGPTAAVFFSATERALPELMQRITAGDAEATHKFWIETLKTAARDTWGATCRVLGNSPAALRAVARADPRFRVLLRTLESDKADDK